MNERFINPSAVRTPVCLCLDLSGSVSRYISLINNNVAGLYEAISNLANELVVFDIAKVTFGGMAESRKPDVQLIRFEQISRGGQIPIFEADEKSLLGAAVSRSMDCLERYKEELQRQKINYYQPILIIISDGQVRDEADRNLLQKMQEKIKELVSKNKLLLIPIGVGDVDVKVMGNFLPDGTVLYSSGINSIGVNFSKIITPIAASAKAGDKDAPYGRLKEIIGKLQKHDKKVLK